MAMHTHGSYGLGHLITAKYGLDLTPGDMIWNLADGGWAKGELGDHRVEGMNCTTSCYG